MAEAAVYGQGSQATLAGTAGTDNIVVKAVDISNGSQTSNLKGSSSLSGLSSTLPPSITANIYGVLVKASGML